MGKTDVFIMEVLGAGHRRCSHVIKHIALRRPSGTLELGRGTRRDIALDLVKTFCLVLFNPKQLILLRQFHHNILVSVQLLRQLVLEN